MSDAKVKEYERKLLRAHSFLVDVPLRTVVQIDLPGGREGMTLTEISAIVGFSDDGEVEVGPVTKALFWLRGLIGRILRWDDAKELVASVIPSAANSRGSRPLAGETGKGPGITQVLYSFENEFLGEIINRTVHCFCVMAAERTTGGYALYLAIYVKRINWFTPVYMAMISPLLKWIIYPSCRGASDTGGEDVPALTSAERPSDGHTAAPGERSRITLEPSPVARRRSY